jgi:hypothetical protein
VRGGEGGIGLQNSSTQLGDNGNPKKNYAITSVASVMLQNIWKELEYRFRIV